MEPINIIDPLTKLPFPNNQIPANRLDAVGVNLASYYPTPNLTDSLYNYAATGTATDSYDNVGIKIDQAQGSTDRLTGSLFYRPSDSCDPLGNKGQLPYFGTCNPTLQLLTYAKYLKTISSSMFLEVSGNFSRRTNNEHWPESGTKDWAAYTGFYGTTTDPIAAGPPNTTITGYATIGVINAAPKTPAPLPSNSPPTPARPSGKFIPPTRDRSRSSAATAMMSPAPTAPPARR